MASFLRRAMLPPLGAAAKPLTPGDGAALAARMLAHLSFGVSDLDRAVAFYDAALTPLGIVRVWRVADGAGYGAPGGPDRFALKHRDGASPPGSGFHLAFAAADRAAVDLFHAAALGAGGSDNGAPGLRVRYGPDYYAAFVLDPEGHAIEAVHSAKAAIHALPRAET